MTRRIVPVATQVLSLLPFAQAVTGRAPSAKLKRNPKKWMPLFGKIARPHKNLEPFGGSAKPTDALIAAAGLINTPYARRVAPGLSGLISVGLAVVAMAGFVRNIQRRKTTRISGRRR
ncbi:hypothetical protein [Asticcacaulis sp.]|uniref:hypothetical protein n=1 Tax=Asticcacaulis sp. TaxID=1872648 RepID=UPI0026133E84|nr:hypothetical protein [Asticcacaulis sp.]